MKEGIEVELKLQILDEAQVKNFLKDLSFISEKRVVDTYLDTKDANLFKKGFFVRIRDNKTLDFKYNLEDIENKHEHCEEHSFSLPLTIDSLDSLNRVCKILGLAEIKNPDLEELLTENSFINFMIIDKTRKTYKDEDFVFCFDVVKGMGKFLEIEAHANIGDDLEKIKNKMREKIKNLKLKSITIGYGELYWKKHNAEIYKQGKYLLEEDKHVKERD
jgi:predicted adenylyl cyclase CyaB